MRGKLDIYFGALICLFEFAFMPVLKGISSVMTPELLKVLAEMGHGDQIGRGRSLAMKSSNCGREFPRSFDRCALPWRLNSLGWFDSRLFVLRIGHPIPRILRGICKLLPLDQYVECPVSCAFSGLKPRRR